MMENLVIIGEHAEYFTPTINFDAETGNLLLEGESYLEDTVKFYEPIIEWLKNFTRSKKPMTLDIKLTYFNTSSSRSILDILYLVKEYLDNGAEVSVNWHVKVGDHEMYEEVEDYMLDTGLKINILRPESL